MFRTTLLLITLCALGACDTPSKTTSPNPGTVTEPTPVHQGIRGVLRRVVVDSIPTDWALESAGGETYKLVGGPVETYDSLLDKEVFIVGVVDSGIIIVDTCNEDTTITAEFNRRPGGRK